MIPWLILICILSALTLFWLSARQRQRSGLPGGRVIYSDTSDWNKLEKPLYNPVLGLTGKPDYLVEHAGTTIPVEVKSSRNIDRGPYDSHIYQLAAYCLLVTYTYGKRPPYGILHYSTRSGKNRTYSIPFSPSLESEAIALIQEMQSKPLREEIDRSHASLPRCQQCGFYKQCDQAIGRK